MRAVAAVACGLLQVLCVLTTFTVLYAQGEGEVLIHMEGHPEALPEATEVLATTGALLEGQHGVKSLHEPPPLGGAAVGSKNGATPLHYARHVEALKAEASPSEVDDEGATRLVEALEVRLASPSWAKDGATPLVAASSALTAPACPLAAASNSTPTEAPPPQHHTCSHVASTVQRLIVAGPKSLLDVLYDLLVRLSAGSAPTKALPPQLPQTFNEWYTAAQSPLRSWYWWIHPSNYMFRNVLAVWFSLGTGLNGSGVFRAGVSAIVFTTLAFAAYSLIGQPCIIIWDSQACLWKPTCMWEPPEEDLLAPATVNPMLVVLRLWEPAILQGMAVVIALGLLGVIPLLAQGLWAVLQSVFRAGAFTRVLLAARPRLRTTLRQMTTVLVWAYLALWPVLPLPYTHALFVVVILSVTLDIEWWFVERPLEGVFFAVVLFPEHVGFCVIFCGICLLDVFFRTNEDPRINALFQEPVVELVQLCAPPPLRTRN